MNDLTLKDTILPPVGQHVAQLTRDLIARASNGTSEKAHIRKAATNASLIVNRETDGDMFLSLHTNSMGCLIVREPKDARMFSEALLAFADAVEGAAS